MENKNINEQFKKYFNNSEKIIFFSGAGISTESGIPDFRSSLGLYSKEYQNLNPEYILSHSCFEKNPELFYKFYFEKMIYENAKPNIAHLAIAKWQEKKNVIVITQNIDGLHQIAGSKVVYELHGSIFKNYCIKCNQFYSLKKMKELKDSQGIPRCENDNGIIKPSVVLYEEALNEFTLENAVEAISNSDLIIVGGTSLTVYPAAGLINYRKRSAKLVIIDKNPNINSQADLKINDSLVNALSQLN